MAWFVVPHNATAHTVTIWIAWWSTGIRPPVDLVLIDDRRQEFFRRPLPAAGWRAVGRATDDAPACRYRIEAIEGLDGNSRFTVQVRNTNNEAIVGGGVFDTLPHTLVARDEVSRALDRRPFNLILGSCFWDKADDGHAAAAYRKLYQDSRYSPHLKILCGDQVYADQPPGDIVQFLRDAINPILASGDTGPYREKMNERYHDSWHALRPMLEVGANVCTTDDHEFWNDYPFRPLPIWPELQFRRARARIGSIATQFAESVQLTSAIRRFDIGRQLSVLAVDTRIHRTESRLVRPATMTAITEWADGLTSPGVLVVGQPLLSSPFGIVNAGPIPLISDHNLPFYKAQYRRLISAISRANHDILVLSGDIHLGRIARTRIHRNDGADPTKLYEIIASPMSLLDTGPLDTQDKGDRDKHPGFFPPDPTLTDPTVQLARVEYAKHLPARTGAVSRNLMMSIRFRSGREPGSVSVLVTAWYVEAPDANARLPRRAWNYTFTLDAGRLPNDGSVPRRAVTGVAKTPDDDIFALVNEHEAWSPRRVHEVIADIDHGRAEYFTHPQQGRQRPIHVVTDRVRGIRYLRSDADRHDRNNLDALPQVDPANDWYGDHGG